MANRIPIAKKVHTPKYNLYIDNCRLAIAIPRGDNMRCVYAATITNIFLQHYTYQLYGEVVIYS